jgi:hypothetical protein
MGTEWRMTTDEEREAIKRQIAGLLPQFERLGGPPDLALPRRVRRGLQPRSGAEDLEDIRIGVGLGPAE